MKIENLFSALNEREKNQMLDLLIEWNIPRFTFSNKLRKDIELTPIEEWLFKANL